MVGNTAAEDIQIMFDLLIGKDETSRISKRLDNSLGTARARSMQGAKLGGRVGLAFTKEATRQLDDSRFNISDMVDKSFPKNAINPFNTAIGSAISNVHKMPPVIKKATTSFLDFRTAMGSLSIMFAGQAISKNMTRIMTSTVGAFNEISKGQSEVGQGLTALSANFMYLKFTVGNAIATALGPLLPTIISVIAGISDWVQVHPKLTAGIIGFMGALGLLMAVGGSFHLFLSGLATIGSFFTTRLVMKGIETKALGVFANEAGEFTKTGGALSDLKAGLAMTGVVVGAGLTIASLSMLMATEWSAENIGVLVTSALGALAGSAGAGAGIAFLTGTSIAAGTIIGISIAATAIIGIAVWKLDPLGKMNDWYINLIKKMKSNAPTDEFQSEMDKFNAAASTAATKLKEHPINVASSYDNIPISVEQAATDSNLLLSNFEAEHKKITDRIQQQNKDTADSFKYLTSNSYSGGDGGSSSVAEYTQP